jgi:hypothetical protein
VPKFSVKVAGSPELNHTSLKLEELYFVPACDIVAKEAISAFHRARTHLCKQNWQTLRALYSTGSCSLVTFPTHVHHQVMIENIL